MRQFINLLLDEYNRDEIERSAVKFFLENNTTNVINVNNIQNITILNYVNNQNQIIEDRLREYKAEWDICDLINLFECLVLDEDKREHGVVFTPQYIVEYIINNAANVYAVNDRIIDPSCGCGAFLSVLARRLSNDMNVDIIEVIENNIYGIDISEDHVRRTKLVLTIVALLNGEDRDIINFNIFQGDSLRSEWEEIFGFNTFDYIVGNPPYVNTHDMSRETSRFLKENFQTTQSGTFNIFYAFIEKSMNYLDENGTLGFIIPNNFTTIEAAKDLRHYLVERRYIRDLIDFNLNLAFNPVKSYNAIIFLDKNTENRDGFNFSRLSYNEDINEELQNANFDLIRLNDLNDNIWHLLNENDMMNINRIENIGERLGRHIRTGIATLKDKVYKFTPIRENEDFYFMQFEGNEFAIEREITRSIIKASGVRNEEDILNCTDRIIFPYEYDNNLGKYIVIKEDDMRVKFPSALNYLEAQRGYLEQRSSQNNASVWYEYGRSQGFNNIGTRLMHPTFSLRPRFMIDEMADRLFVNGYAIFIDDIWDGEILKKILNSKVMDFYIQNTSYSIEGGFRCYQKKYLRNFSIPNLTQEQIEFIMTHDDIEELDNFIANEVYGLNI